MNSTFDRKIKETEEIQAALDQCMRDTQEKIDNFKLLLNYLDNTSRENLLRERSIQWKISFPNV